MSYNVKALGSFERQAKRLIKKYPSLDKEIFELIQSLKSNPTQGNVLGKNCFKIRLAIASKGKGKSGGARIISHVVFRNEIVYLVSIYDKSEIGSISPEQINELLKQVK